MVDLSIVACGSYDRSELKKALAEVIEPVGGLAFVKPGQTVAIKANLVSPKNPDAAATTHPELLAALCELVAEAGGCPIVGDSPGGAFSRAAMAHTYSVCGLSVIESAGGRLNNDFSRVTINVGGVDYSYTGWLQQADHIIDCCKLKTHGMVGLSAAVKNMFGAVPGTIKPEYHYRFPKQEDFSRMLLDLCEYSNPKLSIIDAVVGMEGNGPNNGKPRFVGALIAATKPYYADLAAAAIIPFRAVPPTITEAIRLGLCPADYSSLRCSGDPAKFAVPDYVTVDCSGTDFSGIHPRFVGKLASAVFVQRPTLQPELCVGCKKCRDVCPAGAIEMKNGRPHIDRKCCIRCFCCQEFCPKGALEVHRTWVARMINPRRRPQS